MRSGRSDNDAVAHSQREKLLQTADVEIARGGTKIVARQPHFAVARLDLPYLRHRSGWPVARTRHASILLNSGRGDEIGRASCRERVEISAGAGREEEERT